MTTPSPLSQPLTLPSGLILPNRLIKAALSEELGTAPFLPNARINALYSQWALGNWGLILTGCIHVDANHMGSPSAITIDPSLPASTVHEAYAAWATASKGESNTPSVVQLNHPGRQSPISAGKRSLFSKAVAPSAVPMDFGPGIFAKAATKLIFGTPRALTVGEIDDIVKQFAEAARVCAEAGFNGVQIHAAHGYLLAQFLSGKSNLRQDAYGGTPENRARVVVEVIRAVKEATKEYGTFCVGIKLNSVDHQEEEDGFVRQLRMIVDAGVDFVEVSGGSYEDPVMNTGYEGTRSERTAKREAFFLEFAGVVRREFPHVPLVVTGGFRTRKGMEEAVERGECDLVGIGRPAVLNPLLPKTLVFNKEVGDEEARLYARRIATPWYIKLWGVKGVGAGIETVWYATQMAALAAKVLKDGLKSTIA
ncbi:hypothetical protein OQA88_4421 [Cercophora sp. LCS_1]